MDQAGFVILLVNFLLGTGFGILLAARLARTAGINYSLFRIFALLVAVYFIECAAFAASMGTNVFSIVFAGIWGLFLGFRLRRKRVAFGEVRDPVFRFSLYTCLPVLSFLCIPLFCFLTGWSVLNAADGYRFGIPDFAPWPLNTILGFSLAISAGAAVVKAGILMFLVRRLVKR